MLLASHRIFRIGAADLVVFIAIQTTLSILVVSISNAQEPPPPCSLEVPVYGPTGDRLPFRVTRVTPKNEKTRNLLTVPQAGVTVGDSGYKIFFKSSEIVGREIEVTLQDPKGTLATIQSVVTSCRLRRSVVVGQMETGADVNWINITGKLAGCKFEGDWWVRAVPMFGASNSFRNSEPVDGYVASDGNFWLVLSPNGVRYTVIIGKGKNPIKSIGFDAIAGKNTNLGSVDLRHLCP